VLLIYESASPIRVSAVKHKGAASVVERTDPIIIQPREEMKTGCPEVNRTKASVMADSMSAAMKTRPVLAGSDSKLRRPLVV